DLLRGDEVAHRVDQDLRAGTRHRIQPGLAQLQQHLVDGQLRDLRDHLDLGRAEAVHVDGVVLLDVAQEPRIPVERQVRVVSALHQDLHAAQRLRFVDLRADLFVRQPVRLVVLRPPVEGAEAAVGDADVRVVDVAIDDVADDAVRVLLLPQCVRTRTQLQERCRTLYLEPFGDLITVRALVCGRRLVVRPRCLPLRPEGAGSARLTPSGRYGLKDRQPTLLLRDRARARRHDAAALDEPDARPLPVHAVTAVRVLRRDALTCTVPARPVRAHHSRTSSYCTLRSTG